MHVLPRTKMFKCTGPFLSSFCPDGQVVAISANALHQASPRVCVQCGSGGRCLSAASGSCAPVRSPLIPISSL